MEIRRIPRIKGHRVFRETEWPQDADRFARFNLIYGWNGSGKTTLAGLFRHIQKREPLAEGEAIFEIDDRRVSSAELDTAVLPQIRVFDCNQIKRTVLENPRGHLPPVYYLGEDSVERQEEIKQLREDQNTTLADKAKHDQNRQAAEAALKRFCADRAREIKNLLTVSGGGPYNNYEARAYEARVNTMLGSSAGLKRLDKAARDRHLETKTGAPKAKLSKSALSFPDLRILTRQASHVAQRTVFSKPLPELERDRELEAWVGRGLELHEALESEGTCAFCGNRLSEERLTVLREHYSSEFRELQKSIADSLARIEQMRAEIARLQPPDAGLLYAHLLGDYGVACQKLAAIKSDSETYLDALASLLEMKSGLPFEPINARDQLVEACSGRVAKLFEDSGRNRAERKGTDATGNPGEEAWQAVQGVLESHNRHTDEFTHELETARNALEQDQVAASLDGFRSHRAKTEDAKKKCDEDERRAKELGEKIRLLELQLRTHRRPAEELNQELAAYLGHGDLQLEIEESGYVVTRNGQPAMNLSEGEKTAIAFMHFLKSLSDTSFDLPESIVVIDDPISSLDNNSLFSAFGFMRERTEGAGQLFVLTHNFSFFRQVRKWFRQMPDQRKKDPEKRPARFFMLDCRQSNGERCASLATLDPLLKEYDTEYHYLFSKLYEVAFAASSVGSLESYYGKPNMARRLMEAFLEFRMPGRAGFSSRFRSLPVDNAKKNRVLPFLHTYSHLARVPAPEHDPSALVETPAVLRDLFSIIEELDPLHYRGMCELIGAAPEGESPSEASE